MTKNVINDAKKLKRMPTKNLDSVAHSRKPVNGFVMVQWLEPILLFRFCNEPSRRKRRGIMNMITLPAGFVLRRFLGNNKHEKKTNDHSGENACKNND